VWYLTTIFWATGQFIFTACALLVFLGWGVATSRFVPGLRALSRLEEFVALGICATLGVLQLLHCVLPITLMLLVGWMTMGLAAIVVYRRIVFLSISHIRSTRSWLWLPAVLLILRNAVDSVCYVPQSDSYHFLSLNWFHAHSIVPGLSNLDGRFGFNCASFLIHAMLTVDPIGELGCGILHNCLIITMIAAAVPTVARALNAGRIAVETASTLMLVWPVCFLIGTWRSSLSPAGISPDGTVFLLQQLLVLTWLRAAYGHLTGSKSRRSKAISVLAVCLSATLITVKLSVAIFSMLLLFVLCLLMWFNRAFSVQTAMSQSAIGVCVALGILVPWTFRGIVHSGYPAYPSSVAASGIEWQVSEEMRQEELRMIRDWARFGRMSVSGTEPWLGSWLRSYFPNPFSNSRIAGSLPSGLLYPLFWLVAVVYGLGRSAAVRCDTVANLQRLLGLIGLLSGICWFFTAPHPRFFLGVCYAILGSLTTLRLIVQTREQRQRSVWASVLAVLLFAIYDRTMNEVARGYDLKRVVTNTIAFFPPNSMGCFKFEPHTGDPHRTDSGLDLFVPTVGFRAPLLSVETLYAGWERLELRDPDNLADGFILRPLNAAADDTSHSKR
jgi:hypothetical protein